MNGTATALFVMPWLLMITLSLSLHSVSRGPRILYGHRLWSMHLHWVVTVCSSLPKPSISGFSLFWFRSWLGTVPESMLTVTWRTSWADTSGRRCLTCPKRAGRWSAMMVLMSVSMVCALTVAFEMKLDHRIRSIHHWHCMWINDKWHL